MNRTSLTTVNAVQLRCEGLTKHLISVQVIVSKFNFQRLKSTIRIQSFELYCEDKLQNLPDKDHFADQQRNVRQINMHVNHFV